MRHSRVFLMSLKAGCSATIWIFLAGMLQEVLPVGLGVLPDGDEKAFKRLPSFKKKNPHCISERCPAGVYPPQ